LVFGVAGSSGEVLIPPPDLAAIEERLNQLKRNIYCTSSFLIFYN
jgi:hypothetical protein